MKKPYDLNNAIQLYFFRRYTSDIKMVNVYEEHLAAVLFKALDMDIEALIQQKDYLATWKQIGLSMKHITSDFLEASLAYRRYPSLSDSADTHQAQVKLLHQMIYKVLVNAVPSAATTSFDLEDLSRWGYDSSLEVDEDALWEEM